ncbi:MAG: hypothetical protein ACREFW_00365, partial [Rhizomicrobium sp.]
MNEAELVNEVWLKARESRARREFPETRDAFRRVREAAVGRLFETRPAESDKREELYRLVHILNEVERELVGAMGND